MLDLASLARPGARTAIREPGGSISYTELAERVASRAADFEALGARDRLRTLLPCAPGIETVARALALLECGCVVLPISGDCTEAEQRELVRSFRAGGVVSREGFASVAPDAAPGPTGVAAPGGSPGEAPVLALLSSGSTGAPKIVLRSAQQVRAAADLYARSVELAPDDRLLALVPLEHSYGFHNLLLSALAAGACIVFPRSRHPRGIVDEAEVEAVTLFPAPPVFFDLMVRFGHPAPARLGGVRACISVGAALPRPVHEAFTRAFGVPLWQSYGASEAGPVLLNRSGLADGEVLALGRPCGGVQVTLCDEGGLEVGEGDVGEIVVRSPAVALGYQEDRAGGSRIQGDRFFTGDLGRRRGQDLFFAGRKKLLIAAAGRKVDPLEVERVLLRHPDVADAAVVAHDEAGHEVVKAVVVGRRPTSAASLMAFCAGSLSGYKVPRIVEFRSSLPRNALGKLMRDRL